MFKLISLFILLLFSVTGNTQLRLNEISACNTNGIADEDNQINDWVEIYNSSASTINLSTWYLSNDILLIQKWNFPAITLGPGNYLLVFCSGKNKTSPILHTNFNLNKNKKIILTNGTTVIDSLTVPPIPANQSLSKLGGIFQYYYSPSPGTINSAAAGWILSNPNFSVSSGFYPAPFNLDINHWFTSAQIRYTLDGSEPTLTSTLYTGTFIVNPPIAGNSLSNIPTNPSFTYPVGTYDSLRANNRGWLPPFTNVNKAVIVKAKVFYTGAITSETVSSTYFIDPLLSSRYSLPVMSVIADTALLFGNAKGIYVYGNSPIGNYNELSNAWEIPINLQSFDLSGALSYNVTCGARIHGGGGRHSTIKTFKLFFRDNYENSTIDGFLFDDYIQNKFNNLLLRSPGHRPDCMPHDELGKLITNKLRFDKAEYKQVITFINGEYWGIHSFKEAIDEEYISNKYNLPDSAITVLDPEGQLENGNPADTLLYFNLENFVNTSDMTLTANFNFVKNQMDIENYVDYYCSEIFLGNGDWPNNNIKFWRKNTVAADTSLPYGNDGRWRWIFYDLDGGFGGSCSGAYPTFNTMAQAVSTAPLFGSYTKLFRNLLNNNGFRNQFINRMCDLLNSSFSYKHTEIILDSLNQTLDSEMLEHVERWRYPSTATSLATRAIETPSLTKWNQLKSELDTYLFARPSYQRKHIFNNFLLVDTSTINLNVNDTIKGFIQLNSLCIDNKLDGITGATYPWKGIYFDAIPLTLTANAYPGYKFLNWLETGSTNAQIAITLNSDSIFTAVFGIDTSYDSTKFLRINEISADNNNWVKDEFGEGDDWFEIYNATDDTLNLAGYYVSDDPFVLNKYQIPSGNPLSKISPYGFKLFWADNQSLQGILHCNFKFSNIGEQIYLTAPDGMTVIDSIIFSVIPQDYSYGSIPDGSTERIYFNFPTPNQTNIVTKINETENKINAMIYPNPASTSLTIFYSGQKSTLGTLYSIDGKFVESILLNNGNTEMNLSAIDNGIYFLRIKNVNSEKSFRLVISK